MKNKLINTLLTFENDLIKFLPLAKEVNEKAIMVNDLIEECRKDIAMFTVEDINEVDVVGERLDVLWNKISDLF